MLRHGKQAIALFYKSIGLNIYAMYLNNNRASKCTVVYKYVMFAIVLKYLHW